jgi:hypothetical protein
MKGRRFRFVYVYSGSRKIATNGTTVERTIRLGIQSHLPCWFPFFEKKSLLAAVRHCDSGFDDVAGAVVKIFVPNDLPVSKFLR